MRILALLLALGGCVADGPWPDAARGDELARELAGRIPGPPRSCVPQTQASALRVIDPQTITYREGRVAWVNRLRSACPGLRPYDALIVESTGASYCRNDRIRAFERHRPIPGPVCFLGDFVPYRRR